MKNTFVGFVKRSKQWKASFQALPRSYCTVAVAVILIIVMLCVVLLNFVGWLINQFICFVLTMLQYWHIQCPQMQLLGCMHLMFVSVFFFFAYTGIKSFSFLCWMLRIVGHKVSTKSLMAAFSDCFQSSSCLLLSEYWNLVPNNISVRVKTKIWLPFKTWRSLSAPRWAAYHTGNWNSWCLDWGHQHSLTKTKPFTTISLSLSL